MPFLHQRNALEGFAVKIAALDQLFDPHVVNLGDFKGGSVTVHLAEAVNRLNRRLDGAETCPVQVALRPGSLQHFGLDFLAKCVLLGVQSFDGVSQDGVPLQIIVEGHHAYRCSRRFHGSFLG